MKPHESCSPLEIERPRVPIRFPFQILRDGHELLQRVLQVFDDASGNFSRRRKLVRSLQAFVVQPEEVQAKFVSFEEFFVAKGAETFALPALVAVFWIVAGYKMAKSVSTSVPHMKKAWDQGQALFRQSLARAMSDPEQMEYLSMTDFAVDCYAEVAAKNTYPHDQTLQNWAMNGYMLAWRQHFFLDDDNSE